MEALRRTGSATMPGIGQTHFPVRGIRKGRLFRQPEAGAARGADMTGASLAFPILVATVVWQLAQDFQVVMEPVFLAIGEATCW